MVLELFVNLTLSLFIFAYAIKENMDTSSQIHNIFKNISKNIDKNEYQYITNEIDENTIMEFSDKNTIAITHFDTLNASQFQNYSNNLEKLNNDIYNFKKPKDLNCFKWYRRVFYLDICVNSNVKGLEKLEGGAYKSKYFYIDGELAFFRCEQGRLETTYLVYYEMRDYKIKEMFSIRGISGNSYVDAYIRLKSNNTPFKLECYQEKNNNKTASTTLYFYKQMKIGAPRFIVNDVNLPSIQGFKDGQGPLSGVPLQNISEYFSYVNEDIDISITKSSDYNSASCNLIKYPIGELENVKYKNDTISLPSFKTRTFALFCELHGVDAEQSYNMTLYSETRIHNYVPYLNNYSPNDENRFENFTKTEPCIYGLYWSKTLAKYSTQDHQHVKYEYEEQAKHTFIVCVSRLELVVHYNNTEVAIEKSPNVTLIKWNNNTVYKATEFKISLLKDYNTSAITFETAGKYTVELVRTEFKTELERMTILERKSSDEIQNVQNYEDILHNFVKANTKNSDVIKELPKMENTTTNRTKSGTEIEPTNIDTIIIIVTSLLLVVALVLGLFGWMLVLQQKERQAGEPAAIYDGHGASVSEHVYETVDYEAIDRSRNCKALDVRESHRRCKERSPHPLPPEAFEENLNHYDSPYDWRIEPIPRQTT